MYTREKLVESKFVCINSPSDEFPKLDDSKLEVISVELSILTSQLLVSELI